MDRTMHAIEMAPMAVDARPCAGFGIGYQWRNVTLNAGLAKSRTAATKRSARHLGMATT
jgi:hypothetical protein